VKFNREGGRIDVTMTATPEAVELRIQDTGIGIPAQELEKVFTAFYQVDRRLNRAYGGVGVGLTLAKRYVELHGGSLTLTSEVGKGTTVTVVLPRRALKVIVPGEALPPLHL
jgi:signal transduction histidine kinase